jgi:hypothetical protein
MMHSKIIDYLNVDLPDTPLAVHEVPLVEATPGNLKDYGCLVDDPQSCEIEITRWPAQGWRPVDPGTGDQGGTIEGRFEFWWRGELLYGRNDAVGDSYLLGWSRVPGLASETTVNPDRREVFLWHANYHPDGGQMFYPLESKPFVVPLALPSDDVTPADFVAFYCNGSQGLYIHADIWHEAVFPLSDMSFLDRQGAVHGRVSVDFPKEFGCLLKVPLSAP